VEGKARQVEEEVSSTAVAAAAAGECASSVTTCTSRPTAGERSACVDDLRVARAEAQTQRMRETAARLKANSVKNVPSLTAPPLNVTLLPPPR